MMEVVHLNSSYSLWVSYCRYHRIDVERGVVGQPLALPVREGLQHQVSTQGRERGKGSGDASSTLGYGHGC